MTTTAAATAQEAAAALRRYLTCSEFRPSAQLSHAVLVLEAAAIGAAQLHSCQPMAPAIERLAGTASELRNLLRTAEDQQLAPNSQSASAASSAPTANHPSLASAERTRARQDDRRFSASADLNAETPAGVSATSTNARSESVEASMPESSPASISSATARMSKPARAFTEVTGPAWNLRSVVSYSVASVIKHSPWLVAGSALTLLAARLFVNS